MARIFHKMPGQCGAYILELYWQDPTILLHAVEKERTLRRLKKQYREFSTSRPAIIIFSDVVETYFDKIGSKLANIITSQGLGELTTSPVRKNPNNENNICIWTWAPNWRKLRQWVRDNPLNQWDQRSLNNL